MCLAVPLKITEIYGKEAIAESMGMKRKIRVDFIENPQVGEYVIVHAGFAIERLSEKQAEEDLESWKELDDALRTDDSALTAEK
ncbi:MAG: HypC/HybG/HupF family hydrogenase formation chaperone [Oscillospiraceae bacterium]|nr:HypC/HybG/HupF family hydrogenase formation chaperone [Oscillospiraceae bacterium]MBO7727034.1 HypC/HybG/HupF family hydrogenase formation chaperone [Oscillospiraceae bacterium]MBP5168112.1 HypC/HybG/HupF family hydrogenase formation chaperone [Oscillospiraceae bacterium]